MRERVSCVIGKAPIILVAPHGPDEDNTALIVEEAAKALNCYAVINRGFERADAVDVDKDRADCNRIDHAKQDVVFDEYLKPITKFATKIIASRGNQNTIWNFGFIDPVHIFYVHGCGNHVHEEAGESVEVVVGYGLGLKKDNLSCDPWRKDVFVDLWRRFAQTGDVFEGRGGGRYAGRDSNNMNQYFRKHQPINAVQSMQLEFPLSERATRTAAVTTAMMLTVVLTDYLLFDDFDGSPTRKFI